jgi:hypothetical protein
MNRNTTLYNVHKDGNKFCGPSAIAAILGTGTQRAAQVIRQTSGARQVKGTTSNQMRMAFAHFNVRMDRQRGELAANHRERFDAWAKRTHADRGDRIYLVAAGRHWRVVQGWNYVCGIVPVVTTMAHAYKPKSQVSCVFEIDASNPKNLVEVKTKKRVEQDDWKRRVANANARAKRKAKQLAQELDLEIQYERNDGGSLWWVTPGSSWKSDPRDDQHFGYDWTEVLDVVEFYAENTSCRTGGAA